MSIYERPRRFLNAHLGAVIVITIFVALIAVISVRAIQVLRQAATGAVLRVPGDFPTIQAAIDGAKPGDIVQVSAGIYNENLILNKPVTLVGETFDQVNPVNNQSILDGGGGAVTISIPPRAHPNAHCARAGHPAWRGWNSSHLPIYCGI